MKIFIKNIKADEVDILEDFPISGLIFEINQRNAENVREIIEQIPFYIPIIGELKSVPKFEIEELIFFCKLQGVIINNDYPENLSRPIIFQENSLYNVLIHSDKKYKTDFLDLSEIFTQNNHNIFALVLSFSQFLAQWPSIIDYWSKLKVV